MKSIFKKMVGVALAASLVAGLVGCSSQTTEVSKEEAVTEEAVKESVVMNCGISPNNSDSEKDIETWNVYKEKFVEKYPDVVLEENGYQYSAESYIALVEAGNEPTIFRAMFTEPPKLIRNKAIRDITDILEERGWLDKINPAIKSLLSDENGRIYGLPKSGYALGIMINVDLFKEAGMVDENGYPIYPKTWDELAETAKTIKEKTGAAGLCLLGKDNSGGWHFSNIAWAFGANLCEDNGDGTYTAHLDSKEAIAAMEYVKSLKWDYDVLTADPTNEDWGSGFVQLGTGGAAMYMAANDAVSQPAKNGLPAESLALIPMPAGPEGQYSLFGGTPYCFGVNATDEEVNAALDLLEIMGDAPVVSEDVLAGRKADCESKQSQDIAVIPTFPIWTYEELEAQLNAIVEEYSNVDENMFNDYFATVKTDGNLRSEEVGSTQDMYAELTKVVQAAVTDKNADIPALMKLANDNYQSILDKLYPAK